MRLPIHAVRVPPESNEEAIADNDGEDESAGSGHVAECRPPVRLDGVHVLVVDDQPDARRVLAMVLENVGAVVTTANSARAAVEALLTERPNVLVSDLGMPAAGQRQSETSQAKHPACWKV